MKNNQMDEGYDLTDKRLVKLEKRIAADYAKAAKSINKDIAAFFDKFTAEFAKLEEQLEAGEITREEYRQKRLQLTQSKEFKTLCDKAAKYYLATNKAAVKLVSTASTEVYTENRNFAAYEIESAVNAD